MAAQQHVVRLDVPVQDARRVRGLQRAEDLQADAGGLARRQRALLLEHRAERAALDEFHHDPRPALDHGDVVDVDHGGVVEPGGGAGLTAHPLEGVVPFTFGKVVGDPGLLDGHLAVDGLVLGTPHGAHAAVAELGEQPVAAGDHPSRAGVGRGRNRVTRRGGLPRTARLP
ncbi:hypothetical protein GA0115245_133721, partial [Streptomyces sp. di188]